MAERNVEVLLEVREFFSPLIPFAFSRFKELIKFQAIMQIRRYLQVDDLWCRMIHAVRMIFEFF